MRIPTVAQSVRRLEEVLGTRHPALLRTLGYAESGQVTLSEEDRESHLHILGAPGEGKSKFLEYMVCQDIKYRMSGKSKAGSCFIDSTGNGGTMKKVLAYCAKWGFEHVLVIDPHDFNSYGYVPCINPIDCTAPPEPIEAHVMDSMRVLWSTRDPMDEAIIRKYLPKVIRALHTGNYTLPDSECFCIPFENQIRQILDNDDLDLPTQTVLHRVFRKIPSADWMDFQSTARRLDPFFHSIMKLMFGSRKGLNFQKLISEGWVILVNAYPGGVCGSEHQRLIVTFILNEIVRALERLTGSGFHRPYYVYIDEFGQYTTRKISDILDHRRHYGLRLTLAHQRFQQIEDPQVISSVRGSAKNKLLFYTSNKSDRDLMIKDMGYGGELPIEQVSYALGGTKKQEAVVRIGKQSPTKIHLVDWPDAPQNTIPSFLEKLYTSNPEHYRPKAEVEGERKSRFESKSTRSAKAPDSEVQPGDANRRDATTFRRTAKSNVRNQPTSPRDTELPQTGATDDGGTDSPPVSIQQRRPRKKANLTEAQQTLFDETRKLSGHNKDAPPDGEV